MTPDDLETRLAGRLIDDTPGSAAMEPEEREHLQQTIERIITRARGAQHLLQEQRPWARSYRLRRGATHGKGTRPPMRARRTRRRGVRRSRRWWRRA